MPRTSLVFVVFLLAVTLGVPLASGATSDPVISQVFASGGNAGADFTNDYVELLNRGGTSLDLGGWSIQYGSALKSFLRWIKYTLAATCAAMAAPSTALSPPPITATVLFL